MHFFHNVKATLALVVVAALFLLWFLFLGPLLSNIPSDFSYTAEVHSVDRFYDIERGTYQPALESVTTFSYEVLEEDSGVLRIQNNFAVREIDGDPIFQVSRLYGIDPSTGAHVTTAGDKAREGHLFAPRNLQKDTPFTYWHVNYDGPARMRYVDEELLYGLRVYRYETRYEGVVIDQTADLGYLPGVGTEYGIVLEPHLELWVEPISGMLIKYQDDTVAYYYDLETGEKLHPWNHFSNTYTEESVTAVVEQLRWTKTKLQVAGVYVPGLMVTVLIFLMATVLGIAKHVRRFFTPQRIAFGASGIIILGAFVSLTGWILAIPALTQIVPYASAMNPMTALCFLVLGLAIVVAGKFPRIALSLGALLMVVGVVRIIGQYGLLPIVDVDLWLWHDTVLSYDVPARMAEYTALAFALLGSVFVAARWQILQKMFVPSILTSVVMLLSLLAFTGFLIDVFDLLALPLFFSSAVHTVVLFFVASVALYGKFRSDKILRVGDWFSASTVFFLSMLVTVAIAQLTSQAFEASARNEFIQVADDAQDEISKRLDIYVNALEGARGLFAASDEVERDEWRAYVGALDVQKNYPGVLALGYAIFLDPEEVESHEAAVQAEGFPEYSIRPKGERSLYSTILFIEPFNLRNQEAFGFDMYQEPVRRAAMDRARDAAQAQLSGRITLVQEIDADVQPGFLLYLPHYKKDAPRSTESERRNAIVGYVYSAFRSHDLVAGILGAEGIENIALSIHDGVNRGPATLLYSDRAERLLREETPRFTKITTLYVAGHSWTLTFQSSRDFGLSPVHTAVPLVIILIGLLVSILVTAVLYMLLYSRQQAIEYAHNMTADLRRQQIELLESNARTEAILLGMGDGLYVTDNEGVVILINKAFEELLGLPKDAVVGKKLTDVLVLSDKDSKKIPTTKRPLSRALKNKATTIVSIEDHYGYKRADGTNLPVTLTVSPVLAENELIGAVGVFRDATHQQQIDRAKSEFVSLASHQLKTPLTAIKWYAEILGEKTSGRLTKTQRTHLEEIVGATTRMSELVNALLNISRLELGTFAIEPQDTDLVKLIQQLIKDQQPIFKARKQKVDFTSNKKDISLKVDPQLMSIMLQNLLSNASKYSPDKSNIEVSVKTTKTEVAIAIRDEGYGIPEAAQGSIFKKLFRADNIRTKDVDGTGLGLYIVKTIMDASGGTVSFTSKENAGTTFTITLPLQGMKVKEGSRKLTHTIT